MNQFHNIFANNLKQIMFDRSQKRQAKALRHEIAQQKCKIYQRSTSSKFRNTGSQPFQPSTGQFIIKANKQLKVTTNLEKIVRDRNPSSAEQILSLNASRRTSFNQSSSNLPQILPELEKQNFLKGKSIERLKSQSKIEKTSYLVKSRIQTPKFAQGYKAIKLQKGNKLTLNSKPIKEQQAKQINKQSQEAHFLPVEYYLLDDEGPEELMEKHRIKDSNYVLGFSRWYDLNGASNWKKCRVLGFNPVKQRWQIEWLHNNRKKQVSRVNLYFEGESKTNFEKRLNLAYRYRELSEVYFKYNNEINEMKGKTNEIKQSIIKRILLRSNILHLDHKSLKLLQEIKQIYIRSNHQAQFNASLPFNSKKREEYQRYLPKCLFIPNQQYKIRYNISAAPKFLLPASAYFQLSKIQFKEKTSLDSTHRLKILSYLNNFEQQMQNQSFISWKPEKIYCIDDIIKMGSNKIQELISQVHRAVCDIEHHIGHELDQLYVQKKIKPEIFQTTIHKYLGFLSMVTLRIQQIVKNILYNTFQKLSLGFSELQQSSDQIKIELLLRKKEDKIYYQITPFQIQEKIQTFIQQLFLKLSDISAPTKSYLKQIRHSNYLRITFDSADMPNQLNPQLQTMYAHFRDLLKTNCGKLLDLSVNISAIANQIGEIAVQIRKNVQKRYNYSEISALNFQLTQLQKKFNNLVGIQQQQRRIKVNNFSVKVDDVANKLTRSFHQIRRELYRIVLDKIIKQNQKIDKLVSNLGERLEKSPTNIIQMLSLQKLIREDANEQLDKIYVKIREIPHKIAVLQSIDVMQYKDFQICNKIYIMPTKLKEQVIRVRRELQTTHRKKFGEQLNKDAMRVIQATRECGEQLILCLRLQTLDEMCQKFVMFRNLNQRLETGQKQAQLINEREEAMSWTRTDFTKLFTLKDEFVPYFSLISYAKVFQVHLQLLSCGPFNQIDYHKLEQQLNQTRLQLIKIHETFIKHPKMLRITCQVQDKYRDFSDNLPLIKYLRNADLRERHWIIIRQILTVNPLDEQTSLKTLINLGAKLHLNQLEEISSIASRELFYEKKLVKLKREWKEIKLILSPDIEALRSIINLRDIRLRVQSDIFQIQQILSASFIKFLESQIICWRNQVLYKAYQLLEKWQKVQNEVCLVAAIFAKQKVKIELSGQYIRFQILEKVWRGLCTQIDNQPWFADIMQSKAYDLLTSMQNSIQRIKKHLYNFFEDKKREYARLGCISDDQFMNLLSCDQSDPHQNAIFQQTVRKCFQNIRTLVRNQRHQIIKIRTNSNEEIPFTDQMSYVEKLVQYILPNQLIMQLERKIQKQLKTSLQSISSRPHSHIVQILLLYQRLNFTLSVEEQILKNHSVSAGFLAQVEAYKNDLVAIVTSSSPTPKNQCQLLQALYHLQITLSLWHNNSLSISSFSWLTQPRTYLRNDNYYVQVGVFGQQYGFQIVDLDNIIMQQWSARIFCSYAGVIREKGFCLIEAGCTVGKTTSIRKLAALFGHKQFILDSHPLVSARNLLQYIRMAASGMWVILRNVQRLTFEQTSLLSRNLQVCWFQAISHSREPFNIEGTGIAFKTQNLKIFGTIDKSTFGRRQVEISQKLRKHFRLIFLAGINAEYIVEVKLLMLGFQQISGQRICAIINYLKQKLQYYANYSIRYSDIYLINKLFSLVNNISTTQDVIDDAFLAIVQQLVKDEKAKDNIKTFLKQNFKIHGVKRNIQLEKYKQKFSQLKLHYNQNLLQVYHKLSQSLLNNNFIILVGPSNSGKSQLLSMLLRDKKIQLTFICPNSYQIDDLYGNDNSNGVICSLIEDLLKKIKQDGSKKKGILFDGNIDLWIEPLSGVVSSGHIIQPNGNTLLIQQDLKFIFQCQNINNAPPSLILYSAVFSLNEAIKWQNLFTHYLNIKFSSKYRIPMLIKFLQLFIPYIVDSVIEFYETTCSQYITNKNHCYIPSNSIIISLLNLFQTLLDNHFLETQIQILNQKICSDCFNLFVMAVVWTVGAVLPEESRKPFTRHFKYLIKRAIQNNIQGVNKQSLPDDDQDLFKICYVKDRWIYWNESLLRSRKPTKQLNIFIKPQDIGLSFIIQRYLQKSHSVYLLGVPSSQKVAFLQSIISRINLQIFNIRHINFNPNSKVSLLKKLILKQMSKQKYNSDYNGFVHGKKTLISIRDINLPIIKQQNSYKIGLLQFIRHYYVTSGWYLKDSHQHYSFKSIVFCGTINIKHPLPVNLQKYSNLVFRPTHKDDLIAVTTSILQNSVLNQFSTSLVPLITNLHFAVYRELSSLSLLGIEKSDALCITKSLIKMGNCNEKVQIFRRWMFISEKIYQQKLMSEQSQRLFYLINNVLMQQQRIRYKSIRPNPSHYETYFALELSKYYNIKTIKIQLQRRCSQIIDIESQIRQKIAKRKQSKIQQFVLNQLTYNINQFNNHLSQVKQNKSAILKDNFIKIITHIINTFQLQTSYLFSLTINGPAMISALDLQECLQVVAVIRQAKLVYIKLGESEIWNNNPSKGTWKDIILGLIEQILSSIERGQQLKQIIMYLDDFTHQNDYIIDNLMDLKRMNILPFREEATSMLEYFLQNFKQLHLINKKQQEGNEEYYGIQSKAKLKQKKYELERRQKQRNLHELELKIISKLKFVININEQNIETIKKNKFFQEYSNALRQFSILNLNLYCQMRSMKWKNKFELQGIELQMKSKTIITDYNKDDFEYDSESIESQVQIQINLNNDEQYIIDHILQKMTYKNCFIDESLWMRGRNNNIRILYMNIRQRLKQLCYYNLDIINKRITKIDNLYQLYKLIQNKLIEIQSNNIQLQNNKNILIKQKYQKQIDYQLVIKQNRLIQNNIEINKKQKQQLDIILQIYISNIRNIFIIQKDYFIEIIKQFKDKKININYIIKYYLEAIALVIQKKIKKDQEMYKEIIKDLTNPQTNNKIVKKLSALSATGFYNLSDKNTQKIRDILNQIEKEKPQRRRIQQLQKQESFITRFIKGCSNFFTKLLHFYEASQQKQVKECIRRLSENQKGYQKLKDNQNKNLKNKQYLLILQNYQAIRVKQRQFEQNKIKMKSVEKLCLFLKDNLQKIINIKYPNHDNCSIRHNYKCTVLCFIKEFLLQSKDSVNQIEESIQSYALTLALRLYYVTQKCENDILSITADFQKHRSSNNQQYNTIDYCPSKLGNLMILSTVSKSVFSFRSMQQISKQLQNIKKRQEILQQYFENGNIISLVQFIPGIILIGVEKGGLKITDEKINKNSGSKTIKQLYQHFIIPSGQLTKWIRSKNQQSYHKVCFSSRVMLENKNFMKSAKSIIIQQCQQSFDKRICMVLVDSRQQLGSLIKILKRQSISQDLTIIIVAENQNIVIEDHIYTFRFKHEDIKEFSKQIEKLLVYCDKSQSNQLDSNDKRKKYSIKNAINYSIDLQDEGAFAFISHTVQNQDENVMYLLNAINSDEQKVNKLKGKAIQKFTNWIDSISHQLQNSIELIYDRVQSLQGSDRRKYNNINERIIKYLINIFMLLNGLQNRQKLNKILQYTKYLQIINIFMQQNKQMNKKNIGNIKLLNQIKIYLWNNITPLYIHYLFVILLVFITAEQDIIYSYQQLTDLLALSIQNYQEGLQELHILETQVDGTQIVTQSTQSPVNQDEALLKLLILQPKPESSDSLSQSEEQYQNRISNKLKRKLSKFQEITKSDELRLSIENNIEQWKIFLNKLNKQTLSIPQQLLTQSNIFIIFFILSLVKPKLCLKWLQNLDIQGYYKLDNNISTNNNQLKIYQISYLKQWKYLSNILLYQFKFINTKHTLIINLNTIDIVQIAIKQKINHVIIDFTTILWEIQKASQLKIIEERQQANFNQIFKDINKESQHFTHQYQSLLDNLRTHLKTDSWIIVNLNYFKVTNLTMLEYFHKINQLIAFALRSSDMSLQSFKQGGGKGRQQGLKAMMVYIADSKSQQQQQDILQISRLCKSNHELFNNFLHKPRSFIYSSINGKSLQDEQLYYSMANFKQFYFSSILYSNRYKKQYEKLSISKKLILYQFIFLCDYLIKDYIINKIDYNNKQSIKQTFGRIYGSINIIKNISIINQNQDHILSKYIYISIQPQNIQPQVIINKIQQFILILIDYTFQINYKVSLLGKRIHSTLQFVGEIMNPREHLLQLQPETIISTLNSHQITKIKNTYKNMSKSKIFEKLTTFNSEGLAFQIEQPQKQSSFKQQQERLLQIFIQQSRLSFAQKMQEIQSFSHEELDELKSFVERLKLYDTKRLHHGYKNLCTQIETKVDSIEPRYAKLISRSKFRPTVRSSFNASTIITNALTQLFNREAIGGEQPTQSEQINELQEFILRQLIDNKRLVLSVTAFLEAVREIIRQFIQLLVHSTVRVQPEERSQQSQDEQENLRVFQQQQIKASIRKKIQSKVLVERLIKKVCNLYRHLQGQKKQRNGKLPNFRQQKIIYAAVQLAHTQLLNIQRGVRQNIHNYLTFQKQYKQRIVQLKETLQDKLQFNEFIFNFSHYDFYKIIGIIKIAHAKRFHQIYHLLEHSLKLVSAKQPSTPYKTVLYFCGFKLVNSKYYIYNKQVELEASFENTTTCEDLLVEVTIQEQNQSDSENQLQNGYISYKCPLYIQDRAGEIESRERVLIPIKEILQYQILKSNIYIIT